MNRARRLPLDFEGRPFSTAEGSDAGLSKKRMRASDLARPFPATRTPRADSSSADLLIRAYAQRMSESDFFSHVTAARVHGLPMPFAVEHTQTIHVSTEEPTLRDRVLGVRGHHVAPKTVTVVAVRGVRVTSAVDTWCQLSTMLGLDDLIRIGDTLVRRKHPFAEMRDLLAAVRRYSGRRGVKLLREALIWIRPGVDSPRETDLRLLIVRASLPEPEVNAIIMSRTGVKLATGDLVFRRYRVLLEYDGGQHRTDENQFHWDVDRLDALMEERWRVIRINKSHLHNPPEVIRRVTVALMAGGWRPVAKAQKVPD
ncbi:MULTISPECIES: hypothetical protein [Cryobacterium]|nr:MULTISPECIES: hypothetical protein [Cryobacterium]